MVDNNNKFVKLSKKVINKRKLNNKIKACYSEARKYPLKEFDTIIISGCCFPKIKVIEHVLKNADPQSRIIIRDSYLDIYSIVGTLNTNNNIKIVGKIKSSFLNASKWNSYLLIKNN